MVFFCLGDFRFGCSHHSIFIDDCDIAGGIFGGGEVYVQNSYLHDSFQAIVADKAHLVQSCISNSNVAIMMCYSDDDLVERRLDGERCLFINNANGILSVHTNTTIVGCVLAHTTHYAIVLSRCPSATIQYNQYFGNECDIWIKPKDQHHN